MLNRFEKDQLECPIGIRQLYTIHPRNRTCKLTSSFVSRFYHEFSTHLSS